MGKKNNKEPDYPHSAILSNPDNSPVRILKVPEINSVGLGLVPSKTVCIVMAEITREDQIWYWVDLYGTRGYVKKDQLKIRKNGG